MKDRAEEEKRVEQEHRKGRDPHHALNQPATDPDPTEWPDPYERRPDPRGPETVDTPADPGAREVDDPPRDPSTSEPPPPRNPDETRREERGS
jgi:hypothetical protein